MTNEDKYTTKISPPGATSLEEAAALIKQGNLVAFPTETVYGLGANCFDDSAIDKIYEAKGRPSDNPIIVHVSSIAQVNDIAKTIPNNAKKLMETFWPGPLTLVLKKNPAISDKVTAGLDTVAIRMPDHQIAQALITHAGVPIAAPSANTSGKPSPTTAQMVYQDMHGKIPLIIDSGACAVGIESTVLDVSHNTPKILRPGMITFEMIQDVIGNVKHDNVQDGAVRSPGVKYSHYKPNAHVTIVRGPHAAITRHILFRLGTERDAGKKSGVICFDQTKKNYSGYVISLGNRFNFKEVAQNLYRTLRQADELELESVYVEAVDEEGEGIAIMNRLYRAADFNIEDL